MTTERLGVSIVAAPLAAIDRRALSQAWYSALHLERSQPPAAVPPPPRSPAGAPVVPARIHNAPAPFIRSAGACGLKRESNLALQARRPLSVVPPATMRSIFPLSRRIERTFSRPDGPVRRATFSLGRGGARVHVILQSHAGTVTLVALCRPEMRALVARALAHARLALAARGFHVASPLNGESSCF